MACSRKNECDHAQVSRFVMAGNMKRIVPFVQASSYGQNTKPLDGE